MGNQKGHHGEGRRMLQNAVVVMWWLTSVLCSNNVLTCGLFIGAMGSLEDGVPAVGCKNSCPGHESGHPGAH